MAPFTLAALLMIASGSIHAVVNAIVKGGRDKAAGRAITDATGAIILLPVIAFVPWPHGAWGWARGKCRPARDLSLRLGPRL